MATKIDFDNRVECEDVLQHIISNGDISRYEQTDIAKLIVQASKKKWEASAIAHKQQMELEQIPVAKFNSLVMIGGSIALTFMICVTVWACYHTPVVLDFFSK